MPIPGPGPGPAPERRESGERRLALDRRLGEDRRGEGGNPGLAPGVSPPGVRPPFERRLGDRRSGSERRALVERRLALQSAEDQIHGALKLLTMVADAGALGDQQRRGLEAAILRLRFALDRMERGA